MVIDRTQSPHPETSFCLAQLGEMRQEGLGLNRLNRAEAPQRSPVIAVIGNESGDLDSCAGVLALASIIRERRQELKGREQIIALLPISSHDLQLRRDIALLFGHIGIDPEKHLLFIDQVDLDKLAQQQRLNLVLVDHNRVSLTLEHLDSFVCARVDHHTFDHFRLSDTLSNGSLEVPLELNIVESAGSTCSLIYKQALKWRSAALSDPAFAALLQGAILLDTSDLKDINVTTDLDREAVRRLNVVAQSAVDLPSFEDLRASRMDISAMSGEDLLRRDRKWYRGKSLCFGISSVPIRLRELTGQYRIFGADEGVAKSLSFNLGRCSPTLFFLLTKGDLERNGARELAVCYKPSVREIGIKTSEILSGLEGFSKKATIMDAPHLVVDSFDLPPQISRKLLAPHLERSL